MNILIRGGRVIDPANAIDHIADIYIKDGKICPPEPDFTAELVIDAAGKAVAPGFIDIHMHEDPVLPDGSIYCDEERAIFMCMLRMGVTTAVGGNCGECVCRPADYLDLADKQGLAVNVGMLAGHEYYRNAAGALDKYAPADAERIAEMAAAIREDLERGCLGVSYGIRYVPGMDMEELCATARPAAEKGRIVAAHIRSDAKEVFASAKEFLDACESIGAAAQISHIGSMAGFGQMEDFLKLVEEYRPRLPRLCCDCYPYDAFSTSIGSTTYDEGWLGRYNCDYSVLEVCEGPHRGKRCTEEIFREVRRDMPDCKTICYVMQQADVDMAYFDSHVFPASDGTLSRGQGHPRAAGTFPRFIDRYVRRGVMSLYEAVGRMTYLPAKQLGLENKGRLSVGADADVVIFDPEKLCDRASFSEPLLPPVGIDTVIVSGKPALLGGSIVNPRAGKSVRL